MNPDAVAIERRYNEKNYEEGIAALRAARTETHKLIKSMKPREFEYKGVHSKFGEINTFQILDIIEDHDRGHAAQLRRTLAQVGLPNAKAAL